MTTPIVWSDLDRSLGLNAQGDINLVTNTNSARQAAEQVLGTFKGERPMRTDFASYLRANVFQLAGQENDEAMAHAIRALVESWDFRLQVDSVNITRDKTSVKILVSLIVAGSTSVFSVERVFA